MSLGLRRLDTPLISSPINQLLYFSSQYRTAPPPRVTVSRCFQIGLSPLLLFVGRYSPRRSPRHSDTVDVELSVIASAVTTIVYTREHGTIQ